VCPEGGLSGTGKVRIHRLAARAAASNVCVSRYLQERMVPPWSAAIYNPVSARAFSARDGGSGEEGVIAFAGRLVQEKGLDLLLRALSALPEAKLEVAGDGPMRRQWADLADELDLGRRVSFLGSLPFEGVAELYARAVLVCVPSAWGEPFGYAVAEAMAMGRPVVGTPAGALPELLGGGRGFVAEAVSAEALAQTLVEAFTDDLARQHAGERAREFAVRHLSVNALGPRYERLYKEVAG
jgi:glycosyltransferase involved in cell wall biosynthesis